MLFYGKKTEKQKEKLKKLNSIQDDDYEICVICGAQTSVKKSEPVDRRTDYFPGSGQLCHECAIKNIAAEATAMRNGFTYVLPVYGEGRKR